MFKQRTDYGEVDAPIDCCCSVTVTEEDAEGSKPDKGIPDANNLDDADEKDADQEVGAGGENPGKQIDFGSNAIETSPKTNYEKSFRILSKKFT